MNTYIQKATINTPQIEGNATEGKLLISGRCCPEDCVSYFHPLINWMKIFQMTESRQISVSLDLEYINTSSSLVILRILREIKTLNGNKQVKIVWLYSADDSDMREVGKDLRYILGETVQLETKMGKAS